MVKCSTSWQGVCGQEGGGREEKEKRERGEGSQTASISFKVISPVA
jgi:hypothetical protein